MEKLQQAADLLKTVVSTMDTIDIKGLDNQDKFVGCASAVQKARQLILEQSSAAKAEVDADAG